MKKHIDYLGILRAILGNLQGYRTLAHELIQNADDALNTTLISFDVRDESLVVDNDGIFSDCGNVETAECSWKQDDSYGYRCDFHRFQYIGSGDKRGQDGTTGAFGIGFIAAYQITDTPHLISNKRHWILYEMNPEDDRIQPCPGCVICNQTNLPGTRFILPWATENSNLRKALGVTPVDVEGPNRMLNELLESLPVAMLFLKHIHTVNILKNGEIVHSFQRVDDQDSLIISDGKQENDRVWHILRGKFEQSANILRAKNLGRIEEKRSALVALAIPEIPINRGLLCACLPTEEDLKLPFHINADFFTTNDRKSIILGSDYQTEWNREALKASARALSKAIGKLPILLGAQRFWYLVSKLKITADEVSNGHGESSFAEFWNLLAPKLRTENVICTTKKEWSTSADTLLLLQSEESNIIPVLENLNMKIVNEDLRPYQNLLRSEAVGVQTLNIEKLCIALASFGLNRRTPLNNLPDFLRSDSNLKLIWNEIYLLLDRQKGNYNAHFEDVRRLRLMALAPGRDKSLWCFSEIYSTEETTISLFEQLGLGIPFVKTVDAFNPLKIHCNTFNVTSAIMVLEGTNVDDVEKAWKEKNFPLQELFEWFKKRREQIVANQNILTRLGALTLFPSAGRLKKLNDLFLPGNFEDPLGISEIVDIETLGGNREFLQDLGMRELDFRNYVVSCLPVALNDVTLTPAKRKAAILLISSRAGELKDDEEAHLVLASTKLVECEGGQFHEANKCYFDNAKVRSCIGEFAYFVVLPTEHVASVRELYEWLGVASMPRLDDIVTRVRELSALPYSQPVALQIQQILSPLGEQIESDNFHDQITFLKTDRWLPARDKTDRWYAATELYASYQDYLFSTQALFIDSRSISSVLLQFLEIKSKPPIELVVKHLVYCADNNIGVNSEVYRFLNDNSGDPHLNRLKNTACLLLDGIYRKPCNVFWGEHPFGQYRCRLSEELRSYSKLLHVLGVKESPNHDDTIEVMKDISSEFGNTNNEVTEESYSVLMTCWRELEKYLNSEMISSAILLQLSNRKCIRRDDNVLERPSWLFFENRAGLGSKFGNFLTNNVIQRPLGASVAMIAAGVRLLGTAVTVELVGAFDSFVDIEIQDRIRERCDQIGSVLQSLGSKKNLNDSLNTLKNISYKTAKSIVIVYRLQALDDNKKSLEENVAALYQRYSDELLFVRSEGQIPWSAVARELAVALFPEEDPGRFAAGLKEALSAESVQSAQLTLDELGFSRVVTDITIPEEIEPRVRRLGGTDEHEFPIDISPNPTERKNKLVDKFRNAPPIKYEQKLKSVRTSINLVDPKVWLRGKYTHKSTQELICQICKKVMPFKKKDGTYYFEAVELFNDFAKEFEQHYIALCPLCAAKYKEFVKSDVDCMNQFKSALIDSNTPEIILCLGNQTTSIRFVESHFQDIKTILTSSSSSHVADY